MLRELFSLVARSPSVSGSDEYSRGCGIATRLKRCRLLVRRLVGSRTLATGADRQCHRRHMHEAATVDLYVYPGGDDT